MPSWERLTIVILCVVFVAGLTCFLWYERTTNFKEPTGPSVAVASSTAHSLGGSLYTQIANPIPDTIPDTNPVKDANPVKDLYQNPF
jgi:hypothetical protein